MPEPDRSFSDVRLELEDIVSQVRDKDTSLEKSLDLFEKAIRLGNDAFELIDRVEFSPEEAAELTQADLADVADISDEQVEESALIEGVGADEAVEEDAAEEVFEA